jgi:phosphoglycerate dehydrogenase-like enzyme
VPIHVLETVRSRDAVWNLPASQLEELRAHLSDAVVCSPRDEAERDRRLPESEIVLGWGVNEKNFPLAKKLRWIHITAAGLNRLLFPALVESDVLVTNSRGLHAESMAEHALGVILAFARKLHVSRDAQREGRWSQAEQWTQTPPFVSLSGSTMVLVGLGTVGRALATRARALGVRVVAVRRHPAGDPAPADEQHGADRLHEQLGRADFVVVAAPETPDTRGLIGREALQRMRPSAVLLNLGRGALVDEAALVDALRADTIAGAGLDVFEREPLPAESALWTLPQVILTPHTSGLGPRYWERALEIFRENFRRYREGRELLNLVDKRAGY